MTRNNIYVTVIPIPNKYQIRGSTDKRKKNDNNTCNRPQISSQVLTGFQADVKAPKRRPDTIQLWLLDSPRHWATACAMGCGVAGRGRSLARWCAVSIICETTGLNSSSERVR